jgi:hypothetical protein
VTEVQAVGAKGLRRWSLSWKRSTSYAGFGELEADAAESVLDVATAQRSVGDGYGDVVGFQVLGVGQFLVFVDLAVSAMHEVSGHRVSPSRCVRRGRRPGPRC